MPALFSISSSGRREVRLTATTMGVGGRQIHSLSVYILRLESGDLDQVQDEH